MRCGPDSAIQLSKSVVAEENSQIYDRREMKLGLGLLLFAVLSGTAARAGVAVPQVSCCQNAIPEHKNRSQPRSGARMQPTARAVGSLVSEKKVPKPVTETAPESGEATSRSAVSFHAKSARPKAETPLAREHITIIRAAVRRGPNFASHYTVVNWGCGTSCGVYVIVDNRTGKIYEPPEISKGVEIGVAGPQFRPKSTLMVVASCPPPEVYGMKNCERKFYNWDSSRLLLLKTEPVTPTKKDR